MPKFTPSGPEDPMSTLCRMVVNTKYEDLPANVVTRAKHSILDTLGIIIGGSAMEGIPAVVELVKEKGGKSESASLARRKSGVRVSSAPPPSNHVTL